MNLDIVMLLGIVKAAVDASPVRLPLLPMKNLALLVVLPYSGVEFRLVDSASERELMVPFFCI